MLSAGIQLVTSPQVLILGMVFAIVVLLVGSITVAFRTDPAVDRMRRHATKGHSGGAHLRTVESGAGRRLAKSGPGVLQDGAHTTSAMGKRLARIGYRSPSAVTIYYGARVFLAIGLSAVAALMLYLVGTVTPGRLLVVMLAAAAAGFYLPVLWLAQCVQRRREDVRNGFPDALDMLLVCVEAGASLPAALERVGQESARAHPVLAEELSLMALQINAGTGRAQALRQFADRVGVEEVTSFVTLLIQSEAFGTNIADSLRVQADDMRQKRMLRAEEKANKLPVKIALPLVFFIFPALLIVIMTPIVIRILAAISATS